MLEPISTAPILIAIYVDDFAFFSQDPQVEHMFMSALKKRVVVVFMSVDYFLGTAFTCKRHDTGHLSIHLCQSVFTEFAANCCAVDKLNPSPAMTPYRSGLPIDFIASITKDDPDLKQ